MIVADCNLEAECLEWICGVARKTAAPLLIEPVSMSKSLKLGRLDVSGVNACVTPNLKQLEALTGEREIARGTAALHRMGFGKVMVLAGQAGAHVSESGGTRIDVPAFANTAIADVTGAGDAAVAGFVCGLVLGKSLPDAARIGQAAAAVKLCSLSTVAPVLSRDRVFQLAEVSEEQPPD
jgi:pseudouridine kinase